MYYLIKEFVQSYLHKTLKMKKDFFFLTEKKTKINNVTFIIKNQLR